MKNILAFFPPPPRLTDHVIMIVCTTKLFYVVDRYHISLQNKRGLRLQFILYTWDVYYYYYYNNKHIC